MIDLPATGVFRVIWTFQHLQLTLTVRCITDQWLIHSIGIHLDVCCRFGLEWVCYRSLLSYTLPISFFLSLTLTFCTIISLTFITPTFKEDVDPLTYRVCSKPMIEMHCEFISFQSFVTRDDLRYLQLSRSSIMWFIQCFTDTELNELICLSILWTYLVNDTIIQFINLISCDT